MVRSGILLFPWSFASLVHIILLNTSAEEGIDVCHISLRALIGLLAVCFGAGVLCSFIFPLYFMAFLEAAVLIAAGVLLLGKRS